MKPVEIKLATTPLECFILQVSPLSGRNFIHSQITVWTTSNLFPLKQLFNFISYLFDSLEMKHNQIDLFIYKWENRKRHNSLQQRVKKITKGLHKFFGYRSNRNPPKPHNHYKICYNLTKKNTNISSKLILVT